jgi:hypothetical protein
VRLPATSLALPASFELDAQEPDPEALRALGVVGGELEQGERRSGHAARTITP